MGLAKLYSRSLSGMDAWEVVVEVHVANGLPAFSIVGLPDTEVKESRDRVRSAIQVSGLNFPARRITVNLAPADLPKESGRFDLAIALGIIVAGGIIKSSIMLDNYEWIGELALDGKIRSVHGALAIANSIKKNTTRTLILPTNNAQEASLINQLKILPVDNLIQVLGFIQGQDNLKEKSDLTINPALNLLNYHDFNQVKGQQSAKKALEIAASGRHSLLMIGTPGCGKSMLAARLNSILPSLNNDKAIETAAIYSVSNLGFSLDNFSSPPYRNPHHSASSVALVGGGSYPKPGEISLAHNGVLFLDEIAEFDRKVLELLREPLETKKINISRANKKVSYPADFQLLAAMNPCPCGNFGHPINNCRCSSEQIARYTQKISGPFLDRIDLLIEIPQLTPEELQQMPTGEDSDKIRTRVISSQKIQLERQGKLNYELNNHEIDKFCSLGEQSLKILNQAIHHFGLSARSYYRILKVSRTIADLETKTQIETSHLSQALQYRRKIT